MKYGQPRERKHWEQDTKQNKQTNKTKTSHKNDKIRNTDNTK